MGESGRQSDSLNSVSFFGDLGIRGYRVSYLLVYHTIPHDFVFSTDCFLLSIHRIRDIEGYESICDYLESFQYLWDLASFQF